jgi:hypothetical protein
VSVFEQLLATNTVARNMHNCIHFVHAVPVRNYIYLYLVYNDGRLFHLNIFIFQLTFYVSPSQRAIRSQTTSIYFKLLSVSSYFPPRQVLLLFIPFSSHLVLCDVINQIIETLISNLHALDCIAATTRL